MHNKVTATRLEQLRVEPYILPLNLKAGLYRNGLQLKSGSRRIFLTSHKPKAQHSVLSSSKREM